MTADDLINTPPFDSIFAIVILILCVSILLYIHFGGRKKQ